MHGEEMPLLSVIVPVYNVEEYLANCLESILSQTFRNMEVILIDDGSTDGSGGICDAYAKKDGRIRLIRQKNAGLSAARNTGLDCIQGEYVMFVDSDDMLVPGAAETMLGAIMDRKADLCVCGTIYRSRFREVSSTRNRDTVVLEGDEGLKAYLLGGKITPTAWAKLYAASIFRDIRFPVGKIYEDAYVMPEILGSAGRTVCIGQCLYIQNLRRNSITRGSFSLRMLDKIDCESHLMEYVCGRFPHFSELVVYRKAGAIAGVMAKILSGMEYGTYRSIYKKLQGELKLEFGKAAELATVHSPVRKRTVMAYAHPNRFALCCFLEGVKQRLKHNGEFSLEYLRGLRRKREKQ